ncbi:hypothetical protein ACFWFB_33360, partial [Streptomyces albidoflavus]
RTADRVVTLVEGRVVADQDAIEFARTRLRPRVAVRSPHAARLAVLLTKEARTAKRTVEVITEGGSHLSVYGSSCAEVGETAFRHGILVHQIADETGDRGPAAPRPLAPGGTQHPAADKPERPTAVAGTTTAPGHPTAAEQPCVSQGQPASAGQPFTPVGQPTSAGRPITPGHPARAAGQPTASGQTTSAEHPPSSAPEPAPLATPAGTPALPGTGPNAIPPTSTFVPLADPAAAHPVTPDRTPGAPHSSRPGHALSPLPPPITVRPARSPLRPVRYELRRVTGIATGHVTLGLVLAVSAVLSVLLARVGHTPQARLLAAWPQELPLPPAALGAGLLGAFAFGDEFKHPALAADRGTVPRRLGLLAAKLLVSAATAVLMAGLVVGCDAALLHLVYGPELTEVPVDWPALTASWFALVSACGWAGVLASGVFRSTAAGLAAVVAVPVVIVP